MTLLNETEKHRWLQETSSGALMKFSCIIVRPSLKHESHEGKAEWNDRNPLHLMFDAVRNELNALLLGCCLTGVALDTRAEGRHPPTWLLLPGRGRRRWHYCKCVVRARRHCFSSTPRPSAELPGSGDDNSSALWIQLVSKICHAITVCLPHGIPSCTYIRWLEANISVCTPQRTPTSCIHINPSFFTIPVRWDWQPLEVHTLRLKIYAARPACVSFTAGGGGESRPGALPRVRQGPVSRMRATTWRCAVHPSPTLALRAVARTQLFCQLLVVVTADP